MKKTLLTVGIVGALFATNSYADNQQSILVSYTCPDTCTVTNDEALTKFGCVYPDTKDCGTTTVKILEFMTTPETINQQTNEKSKPVAARAAKKTTQKPNVGNKPKGSDKAAGGIVSVTCPAGCNFKCDSSSGGAWCWCEDGNGKHCGEETVHTGTLDK